MFPTGPSRRNRSSSAYGHGRSMLRNRACGALYGSNRWKKNKDLWHSDGLQMGTGPDLDALPPPPVFK